MKSVLEKQLKQLEGIKNSADKDKVIQLTSLLLNQKSQKNTLKLEENQSKSLVEIEKDTTSSNLYEKKLEEDEEVVIKTLKNIDKSIQKGLLSSDQGTLNDGVKKLNEKVKEQSKVFEKVIKTISPQQAKDITDKSLALDQFKTGRERRGELKESIKSFFTLKGFLNKTGIIDPKSTGSIATALNKREARMQFVKDRMSIDFEGKGILGKNTKMSLERANPKMEGESERDYGKRIRGLAKETFGRKFEEAQGIKEKQRSNEKLITELKSRGFSKNQISRRADDPYAQREKLARQLSEVDTRYKIEGITEDKEEARLAKTKTTSKSKVKNAAEDKEEARLAKTTKKSNVIPFRNASPEADLENTRLQERQAGLLEKIEENTSFLRNISGSKKSTSEVSQKEEESSSLLPIPAGKKVLDVIKGGAASLTRFAGSKMGLRLGGALSIASGAATAYEGWQSSEEERAKMTSEVDASMKRGEITEAEAKQKKSEIENKDTEKKSAAVGSGTGMAAGGIAGAKLGAMMGSILGPIGAGVGALAGGALGAFAGSELGKTVGEYGGKAINLGKQAVSSIYDRSNENSEMRASMTNQQPVVVNAPTTNIANSKQSLLMPTPVRNEDYAINSYNRKVSFVY